MVPEMHLLTNVRHGRAVYQTRTGASIRVSPPCEPLPKLPHYILGDRALTAKRTREEEWASYQR